MLVSHKREDILSQLPVCRQCFCAAHRSDCATPPNQPHAPAARWPSCAAFKPRTRTHPVPDCCQLFKPFQHVLPCSRPAYRKPDCLLSRLMHKLVLVHPVVLHLDPCPCSDTFRNEEIWNMFWKQSEHTGWPLVPLLVKCSVYAYILTY